MSTSVTRRLSARRGSTTAPDPFAKNAHLNRESSSILTIVRVTSSPAMTPTATTTPTGPIEAPSSPRRAHRRIGSNPNSPLPTPGSPDPPALPGRLSFAFSSFGAPHQQAGPARPRPASPRAASSFSTSRLNPEQLLEVAKQATNPRYVPPSPAISSASHSPDMRPNSPLQRSSSPQGPHSPTVSPATFTPLPPDVYLPFLDRPAEVSALLSSPPSAKLFALLAQTFPKNVAPRENDQLPINTANWSFADLSHWLKETTRDEASDAFWVQTARRCILLHSELIWERLKGALGVPPELDVEYTEAEYNDVFEDDDESDEVLEDEGKMSVGHWDDWDATMDSPVFDRKSAGPSPHLSRRASALVSSTSSSSTPTIMTQLPTPQEDGAYFAFSPSDISPSVSGVIIEPVIATSESANPPPLSLPASLSAEAAGLGDIGEEDEEDDSSTPAKGASPGEILAEEPQLHGLRISTPSAPLPSPGIRSATTGAPLRSPSFSARDSHSPSFPRSNSSSSLRRSGSFGSVHSVGSASASDRESGPYDPVADRAPGNPIFPSNFARLALGPTLAANNPALRSPTLPPQSKYSVLGGVPRRSSSTRSIDRGNRFFRRSFGQGGDDYAVTVASGSSAGGSVRDVGDP
ncbi:hypothetical protein B0H11DRAFT_2276125 [Mycena galericulata]|nr:hypothetical protein B0H11DRAFT_2276125 [Mycena galericulata]